MLKHIFTAVIFFYCLYANDCIAQSAAKKYKKAPKKEYYRVGQWVEVEMKDGTFLTARVLYKKRRRNQYWLYQVGGTRQGTCHAKYLRPVEIDEGIRLAEEIKAEPVNAVAKH